MKWRILLFVMVMLFVGISVSVDAAVLCSNPSGSVFVRAQCKGNEQQLDLAALGLSLGSIYVRESEEVITPIDTYGTATAICDAGDLVLGGGHNTGATRVLVGRSFPDTPGSWTVSVVSPDVAIGWFAVAVCIHPN